MGRAHWCARSPASSRSAEGRAGARHRSGGIRAHHHRRYRVAFVDVPGHEQFVRTMLAGAGGVDAVLLIAADESVKPQTREHFRFAICSGFPAGVRDHQGRCGRTRHHWTRLAGSPGTPVGERARQRPSGRGIGAHRRRARSIARSHRSARRRCAREAAWRRSAAPIDRAFTMHGFGTVATGTLLSGEVHVGDALELPRRQEVVKGVRSTRQGRGDGHGAVPPRCQPRGIPSSGWNAA